jgi:DNA adenine methylase
MVLYPFTWPGSKYRARTFVSELLPERRRYVEPFGGSAVVLLNRDPAPIEVYNDVDERLTNFFRVLREQPDELVRSLELTPYSRREFEAACEADCSADGPLSDIERARLFFVRIQQSAAMCGSDPTPGAWLRGISQSRRGRNIHTSSNQSKISALESVAERLHRVQLDCKPATDVLTDYDSNETLFYCDPPYPPSIENTSTDAHSYVDSMTDDDHRDFLDMAIDCEGDVAISSYATDLYEGILADAGWFVSTGTERTSTANQPGAVSNTRTNQEVLWTSYDPDSNNAYSVPAPSTPQSTLDKWSGNTAPSSSD